MITSSSPRAQRGMSTVESAIAVAVGAIGMVLGIVLLVQYATSSYTSRDSRNESSMSHDAIMARLKPVGEIGMYDPNAPQPIAAKPVAIAAAAPSANKAEATFKGVCSACHGAGVMGAPTFGDKAAWGPRIAKGLDVLYVSAIKGKNAMPAKGGNPTLADDDIKAAVQYMVNAAK
jgi:cytochrome c5